jgi:hypothetical protein
MTDHKDLTENRIPHGLLDPDTRKRMEEGLGHGWTYFEWDIDEWVRLPEGDGFWSNMIYQAIPAPVGPERVTRWGNVHLNAFGNVLIYDYDSREVADENTNTNRRIAVLRITYDKHTGENPVVEVDDV